MAKKSFSKWFTENLRVQRYPLPGEIRSAFGPLHVINVSDEYISHNHIASQNATRNGERVFHHWFPLNECTGHMGLNSLFGALVVMHEAEVNNDQVLLHCHAGANRSPMVRAAYYFMRTGRHLEEVEANQQLARQTNQQFIPVYQQPENEEGLLLRPNMLLVNCENKMLPPLVQLEKFLKLLGTKLEELELTHRGGLLTQLKLETGLQ